MLIEISLEFGCYDLVTLVLLLRLVTLVFENGTVFLATRTGYKNWPE